MPVNSIPLEEVYVVPMAVFQLPSPDRKVLADGVPDPNLAVVNIPDVILAASIFGMSAATKDLNAGIAAAPVVGPANTRLAPLTGRVTANVPLLVIGDPVTANRVAGTDIATLVKIGRAHV